MEIVRLKYGSEIVQVDRERLYSRIPYLKNSGYELDLMKERCTRELSINSGQWGLLITYVQKDTVVTQFPEHGPLFVLNVDTVGHLVQIAHGLGMTRFLEKLLKLFIAHSHLVLHPTEHAVEKSLTFFSQLIHLGLPDFFIDTVANILSEGRVWHWPNELNRCWSYETIKRFIDRRVVYYGKEENVYLTVEAWCVNNCDAKTTHNLLHALRPDSDDLTNLLMERISNVQATSTTLTRAHTGAFALTACHLLCVNLYTKREVMLKIHPSLQTNDLVGLPRHSRYFYKLICSEKSTVLLKLPIRDSAPSWQYVSRCCAMTSNSCRDVQMSLCHPFCFVYIPGCFIVAFHLDGPWILNDNTQKEYFACQTTVPFMEVAPFSMTATWSPAKQIIQVFSVTSGEYKRCVIIKTLRVLEQSRKLHYKDSPWESMGSLRYVTYPPDMTETRDVATIVSVVLEDDDCAIFFISAIRIRQRRSKDFYITLDCSQLLGSTWKRIKLEPIYFNMSMDHESMLTRGQASTKWLTYQDSGDHIVIYGGDPEHPINPLFLRGSIVINLKQRTVGLRKYANLTLGFRAQSIETSII